MYICTTMARDKIHFQCKNALIKKGWTVTHDPFEFKQGGSEFEIDLGAERIIGLAKGTEKIAVEVKTFGGISPLYSFHLALGQYLNYLLALKTYDPERVLYLAIPSSIYKTFFQKQFPQDAIKEYNIKLIVFNPVTEIIEEWIK